MRTSGHTEHGDPDRVGFESDLRLPLRLVDNMLVVDYGEGRMHEFADVVKKHGPLEAQKHWNHFHMGARTEDLAVQRQWAYELLDAFREKATSHANLLLVGELRDDGYEIEVTFWTSMNAEA